MQKRVTGGGAKLQMAKEISRRLIASPFFHQNGLSAVEETCAAHGTIVVLPTFNGKLAREAIERYRISSLRVVPSMLAMLFEDEADLGTFDLSSVTTVQVGAAPLTKELLMKTRRYFPRAAARITNSYGLSESAPDCLEIIRRGFLSPISVSAFLSLISNTGC